MESTYCNEIDVTALDEDIIISLYKNEGDKNPKACIGLDIDTAKAICKMLVEEIAKAEENYKEVVEILKD